MHLNRTRTALFLLCVSRAGLRPGVRLIEFIEDWQRCVTAAGEPIGIERYIASSGKYSRRTAYSRLALFRKTFPQLGPQGLPDGLMGPLLERLAAENVPQDDQDDQ
jgi:hypothetical protein